jgi:hypothetical protein
VLLEPDDVNVREKMMRMEGTTRKFLILLIYLPFPSAAYQLKSSNTHIQKPKLKHQYCLTDIKARSTKPIVHKARCYV